MDPELDRSLSRFREVLEERFGDDLIGARRLVDELGNAYWDLKPDYVLGEDIVL